MVLSHKIQELGPPGSCSPGGLAGKRWRDSGQEQLETLFPSGLHTDDKEHVPANVRASFLEQLSLVLGAMLSGGHFLTGSQHGKGT